MSAVVTKPASEPGRRLRFPGPWGSAIGLKIVMAVTGVILSGFVLVHMLGNLQVFQGAKAINDYGELLHKEPAVLWLARLTLLTAVGMHIGAYLLLTAKNRSARPRRYQRLAHRESTFASRSMTYTGPLLLAFIVYHLLHLTTGTVHPNYDAEGDVYHNLVTGLRVVPVALFYVLAMAALGYHLWHGIWSMCQTLGAEQAAKGSTARRITTAFTLVVALGFAAVPLAIVTGLIKQ
jgi:succinate dehydrogenase / fumarate reductase cytochrome b subunit